MMPKKDDDVPKPRMFRLDEATDKPTRNWGEQGPAEKWTKSLPSVQVPATMYEMVQELSVDPRYEYDGKVAPIMREALEEFIERYADRHTGGYTIWQQIKSFRDYWVEEIVINELMNHIGVIESSFDRWRVIGDWERVVGLFEKLMESVRMLPDVWRKYVIDHIRQQSSIKDAMEFALENAALSERRKLERAHEMLYGDE